MIPIAQAEQIILDRAAPLPGENRPLLEALGFALSRDIRATEDVPPFHRAMMDGYALVAADTRRPPARLRVVDFLPAGASVDTPVQPGTAVKIMTGAPVPPGADAVQKREAAREEDGGRVEILEPVEPGRHIASRGSEFRRGDVILEQGQVLAPSDLGVLAIFGFATVPVHRQPALALVNTGTELVDIDRPIHGGQIRNSNLYTIVPFLAANGFPCAARGVVPDEMDAIRLAIREAGTADVILLTGGVSKGDFDLVADAVSAEGFEIPFQTVAIKPGKPIVFACREGKLLFGLSGNPVSSLLQAARFLLPALRKMAGYRRHENVFYTARLMDGVRHRPGRTSHRPGRLVERDGQLWCRPLPDKGSADLFAWRRADCLYLIPPEADAIEAGSPATVMLLEGFFPSRNDTE